MRCPRCSQNGYSEENRPAMASSLEDSDGDMYYSGNCILCGYHKEIIEAPACPMPPKEHTRHPDGKGGFIRQINHLTGLDRIVWDYRDTIAGFGKTPKEIATKLNELRPGSRLNGNMVAASLNRLANGQIEKKVREEA